MTTYANLTVIGVMTAATLGSVIGAMILYSIGLLIDVERLERIVARFGHLLRIEKADIRKADTWFDRFGYWTVFFCRMVPLVRSLISIPAGMSNMKFSAFILLTTLGTLIWNALLVAVGVLLGENWEAILGIMDVYSTIVYSLLGAGVILMAFIYIKKWRK